MKPIYEEGELKYLNIFVARAHMVVSVAKTFTPESDVRECHCSPNL